MDDVLKAPVTLTQLPSKVKRVDVLSNLQERLLGGGEFSRSLVYGLPAGYGGLEYHVAIAMVKYLDDEGQQLAARSLPYGISLIGLAEFGDKDEGQDVYGVLEQVDNPILLKVMVDEEQVVATTGLDFLTKVELNVIDGTEFWNKSVVTFRLKGDMLLTSLLELPDLRNGFDVAKKNVMEQAAYSFGKDNGTLIVPPEGNFCTKGESDVVKGLMKGKVEDLVKVVGEGGKNKGFVLTPPASVVHVNILFDQTKSTLEQHSLVVVFERNASCKYFEHYLGIDALVVLPRSAPNAQIYEHFNTAVCNQLEVGFHLCTKQQLVNSISAEKPEVFHFWPPFSEHFVSAVYPSNTSLEKLKDLRLQLHELFFVQETRPYFRQSAALFQAFPGLICPHISLKPKYPETELVKGNYEYRHYMQDGFNDDGWGCAYRSLQTIVSWFRLQGFTSREVPTHKEIQECLVSLGDKPQSFIGSKQWIGSTEVSFVLEALLGISCRIMSLTSGGAMASRVNEIQSHFRIHGTPIMVGGGVLAHTIIGACCEPDSDTEVNFLVLDPHYTGKDELKSILTKGWVGWKDNNFWSKKDFYNLCMPLLPATI